METAARFGETATLSAPSIKFMVAVLVFVLSVTEVAVNVTAAGLGMVAGPM
jgi:hypothetical protein